jgi:hypothetical protein
MNECRKYKIFYEYNGKSGKFESLATCKEEALADLNNELFEPDEEMGKLIIELIYSEEQ